MKGCRNLIGKILCEFDLFSAEPTLRHKQEPFSSTSGLGIISLLLYGFFIWLFVKGLMEIVNMDSNQINTSQTLDVNFDNRTLKNFMFGVQIPPQFIIPKANRSQEIGAFDLNELRTYFTFEIAVIPYGSKNYIFQQLKTCEAIDWKELGDEYQRYFNQNQLFNSLCPKEPIDIENIVTDSHFLYVNVYNCINDTAKGITGCKTKAQIQNFRAEVISSYGHFPLWLDYLVKVPQLGEPNPVKYVVDTKRFAASVSFSEIGFVGFDSFTVTTDQSIWPIVQNQKQDGGIYTTQAFHSFTLFDENAAVPTYVTVFCYIRPSVFVYDRSITKIDNVISYVGGLLGIVLVFLGFFFQSYNQYRYELKVGESSFNYYKNGELIKQKDLNPWVYIKYSIWDWIALLCDKQVQWKGCKEMDETRQQAIFMMDVEKLFRRLQFLERVIIRQSDPNMVHSLTLVQPGSIEDFRKKRLILDYYQEIIRLEECMTVQDSLEAEQNFKQNPKRVLQYLVHSTVKPENVKNDDKQESEKQKQNVKENDESEVRQVRQSLKLSLMKDLGLEHEQKICQRVAAFHGIATQAKQLQIGPEFVEIEKQMAESFLSLSPERKSQVILNMPIKILHRLRLKAIQLPKSALNKEVREKQKDLLKQLFMGLNHHKPQNNSN